MKIAAIVIFVLMYVLMIALPKRRFLVALGAAALFLITGIAPPDAGLIDWNILLMITGTMLIVDYFISSGMPGRIADSLMKKAGNVMWLAVLLSLFAGIVSAFLDNVATVLMIAPVGLAVCKKLNISPVPMLISISVSSNLQGAATLVGDTTSIMLSSYAKMDFASFFVMDGRPGIFFAVELGALATVPIIIFLFRKERHIKPEPQLEMTKITDYLPGAMLLVQLCLLIAVSFIPDKPAVTNGVICMACGVFTIIAELIKTKDKNAFYKCIKNIDYQTVLLLLGLFIVIGGITNVGIIDDIAGVIASLGKNGIFLLFTVIVWGSVLVSAFIDNIPYVATMLPVITTISASLSISPYLLYFGLLCGATLGGNITPIGASANITTVGMLRKEGYTVRFRDFMRIGLPFTLTATAVSYIYLWVFWR